MTKCVYQIPERFKGGWCNAELAEKVDSDFSGDEQSGELSEEQLRERWAKALLAGDMKSAHRAWGRWQGFNGGDPWEDSGWRNLWEAQRRDEQFWKDFEDSICQEKVWLRTFISYWEGAASLEG
jgi:hypothetical protein